MSPLREFFFASALALGLSVASVLLMLAHRDIRPTPKCPPISQSEYQIEDCAVDRSPPQRRFGDKIWKFLIG